MQRLNNQWELEGSAMAPHSIMGILNVEII